MKTKLLLSLGMILSFTIQNAQVSNYTFTQSISNYGAPSTGTFVGLPLQDDDINLEALPFTFTFNNVAYNTVYVSANGYLSFSALTNTVYNPISNPATSNIISGFGQDLVMGIGTYCDLTSGSNTITNCNSVNGFSVGDVFWDHSSDFGGVNPTITAIAFPSVVVNINATSTTTQYTLANMSGYIKHGVWGTAPNRVCEFEFSKFSRYVYDEYIHFKIRLYETSNKIEILYGEFMAGIDQTPSEVGLKGSTILDFNSRNVTLPNPWISSLPATFVTEVCDFQVNFYPSTGVSYMWSPPACAVPVITVTPSSTVICAGSSVTLTAAGAQTYSWSNGSTSPQLAVTLTNTATYTVTGYNAPICQASKTYTQNVSPCTGIADHAEADQFLTYPNPFNDLLTVSNSNNSEMTVSISDALGKLIYTSSIPAGTSRKINTGFLNSGLYFITLSDKNKHLTKKIIKE